MAEDRGLGWTGTKFEVTVGPVAHGGHCVARHEGRVVFVRHCLPGERVRAVVTDGHYGSTFWRAHTVEALGGAVAPAGPWGSRFGGADPGGVLEPAAARVAPPCPWAGPGRCGGCDLQHA